MASTPDPFELWLKTGTVKRKTVEIYMDQAASAELDEIVAEFEQLKKRKRPETITEQSPLAELEQRWNATHERWEASKAIFTLVRLSDPIREQLSEEFVEPAPPKNPGKGASDEAKAEWAAAVQEWQPEAVEIANERDWTGLLYGIESVEMSTGTLKRKLDKNGRVKAPAISRDRLTELIASPYGPQWHRELADAFNAVSHASDGGYARPLSLGRSGSDPA